MGIFSAVEQLTTDHSMVTYDSRRCLNAQSKFANCEACLQICPVNAIQAGRPPRFNPEICAGCMACLPLCPLGAYDADDAIPDLLDCAAHAEDAQVELVCHANPQAENGISENAVGIRINGCLAELGSGIYLSLIAMGIKDVTARLDACPECPWGTLKGQVEAQVKTANHLLSAWDKDGLVQAISELKKSPHRPLWDAKNPPLSRRDLFAMLTRQGRATLSRVMEKEKPSAGKQIGRGHLRLANAVMQMSSRQNTKDISLDGLGFGMVTVSEACTACGSCARFCPTGTLDFRMDQDAQIYSLSFKPQACIGCQACSQVCVDSAISVDLAPSLNQVFGSKEPLVLQHGELSRCERCHAPFAARPGTRLCPNCEFRQKNPFGSRLPKGFNLPKARES